MQQRLYNLNITRQNTNKLINMASAPFCHATTTESRSQEPMDEDVTNLYR